MAAAAWTAAAIPAANKVSGVVVVIATDDTAVVVVVLPVGKTVGGANSDVVVAFAANGRASEGERMGGRGGGGEGCWS